MQQYCGKIVQIVQYAMLVCYDVLYADDIDDITMEFLYVRQASNPQMSTFEDLRIRGSEDFYFVWNRCQPDLWHKLKISVDDDDFDVAVPPIAFEDLPQSTETIDAIFSPSIPEPTKRAKLSH